MKQTTYKETVVNDNKDPNGPVGDFGFSFSKGDTKYFLRQMTKMNAATLKMHHMKCANLNNRDMYLVIWSPDMLTWKQKLALKIFKRWF